MSWSTCCGFVASETFTRTPGLQNFGLDRAGARGGTPMAVPPPHGPDRRNPDGSKVRGGILSAWDPATQRERWFALGGGQSGGGTLSLASNVVVQTMVNGRLRAFTADKGELLLDMALPLASGVGPPITFMLDGKQYIAVIGGTGSGQRGRGAGLGVRRSRQPLPLKPRTMRGRHHPLRRDRRTRTRSCSFIRSRTRARRRRSTKCVMVPYPPSPPLQPTRPRRGPAL
jgi:hypothetical protein